MFSKSNNTNATKGAAVPSILSRDLSIKGDITSEGEVQLDGKIEGNVEAQAVTLGQGARVLGDLTAERVMIHGQVQGTISAEEVVLTKTAQVEGDIYHQSLTVESGARIKGHVSHKKVEPSFEEEPKLIEAEA